jgi:hypothetical protein
MLAEIRFALFLTPLRASNRLFERTGAQAVPSEAASG